tara:strand:+ start:221 stop:763 length:543 start_codon:yes stop_codon:yes gene_type:complete
MQKEDSEKELDNIFQDIFENVEKEEFKKRKDTLLKIKSDVEKKIKGKTSAERQMLLMDMQRDNIEELTGYANQIKEEQDAFYKKHEEVIKNLRQKRFEKEALDIISDGMKDIEKNTLDSVARSESPGLSQMLKELQFQRDLEFDPNVFEKDINNGGKKKKTKQRKVKHSKRKTKKRNKKN